MGRSSLRSSWLLLVPTLAACAAPAPPPLTATLAPAPAAPPPAEKTAAPRAPFLGPHGEMAGLARLRVHVLWPSGDEQTIEPGALHPPSGQRNLTGIAPTEILFLDDGTLLVGVTDGTVTALEARPEGWTRRWSLGFRGAIRGLVPAGDGLAVVTTENGVMALLGADGRLRWEHQITGERLGRPILTPGRAVLAASPRGVFALSLAGEPLFSHASPLLHPVCPDFTVCPERAPALVLSLSGDEVVTGGGLRFRLAGPHVPVPSLEPTFPLTFRREHGGAITSLVASGPAELLALECGGRYSDFSEELRHLCQLVRVPAARPKAFGVPENAERSEVFLEGTKPARAPMVIDALVPGPGAGDKPWILARRLCWERIGCESGSCGTPIAAGQILEVHGRKVEESRDLFEVFAAQPIVAPALAAPVGPTSLVCFSDACATLDGPAPKVLSVPEVVASVGRVGDREWVVGRGGGVFRREGDTLVAVPGPGHQGITGVAGAGEKDAWADFHQPHFALHFDGVAWTEVAVPTDALDVLVARASDDVWSGSVHWDGQRWSRVFGAPRVTGLVARGREDVWAGGGSGLWHGTAPGPVPVRLATPRREEGAIVAPPRLTLGAPETGYAVERVTFPVGRGAPMTEARSVSASADGVLWLQSWDRVVEVDDHGKATTLRPGRDVFGRWAFPEGKGRGYVIGADELLRRDGRKERREDVQLDSHVAVSIQGAAWVVGSSGELSAQALVRPAGGGAFQPVLGLPSAAWSEVAAAPDGGAWFVGGLTAGPAGEGILVHARGRLGSEATERFDAPAALLAVAAFGADEAWAVGAAGAVVHVKGGSVVRATLPSGAWLRAVGGSGPGDVWMGGEDGTLLHYDGREVHAVENPLGGHAAITGIAAARGAVWAVGPSGILRVSRKP